MAEIYVAGSLVLLIYFLCSWTTFLKTETASFAVLFSGFLLPFWKMRKLSGHLVEDHQDEQVVIARTIQADICKSYDALNISKPSVKAHEFILSTWETKSSRFLWVYLVSKYQDNQAV